MNGCDVSHRTIFDFGDEKATCFLREKALSDQERHLSLTITLFDSKESAENIVGYHTLVITQVRQEETQERPPAHHARNSGNSARTARHRY